MYIKFDTLLENLALVRYGSCSSSKARGNAGSGGTAILPDTQSLPEMIGKELIELCVFGT